MSLLQVDNITLRFGGLTAVNQVSFKMKAGQIMAVIGPNGAGKTSLFNAISGVYTPDTGQILLNGKTAARPFTRKTAIGMAAAALFTLVFFIALVNMEAMWEAVIAANYVYQEPFPWGTAFASALTYLGETPARYVYGVGLLGAVMGAVSFYIVWWRGRFAPHAAAAAGLARTFQNPRLFYEMSVLENVLVGMDRRLSTRFWHAAFRLPLHHRDNKAAVAKAMEILRFVKLDHLAGDEAASLCYGHQRKLEIARALASEPVLLLLDEPGAGMNPSEIVEIMQLIRDIRDRGVAVLLIEHHMRLVMGISDYVVVLEFGNKIAEGLPEEIRANPKVRAAYLGNPE